MNYRDLKRKQNTIMLRSRIKFTHKCLMKLALNTCLIGEQLSSATDLHAIFTPIAPKYSLN